jgi:ABC-type spermidine/putrescine transport system permease subunit I
VSDQLAGGRGGRAGDGDEVGARARDWAAEAMARALPYVPLVWLGALFVGPLVVTVIYAFANATFGGVQLAFTFTNFDQALSGFYLTVFLRTLEFAGLGTLLCLVVATPVAYAIAQKAGRMRPVLLVLLLVPFWTSFLIRTLAWETLLAANGPVDDVLNFLGLHHGLLNVLDTQTAVFIGIVYGYLPLMALPLYVAFERIPKSVIEASKDLGAGRLRTFVRVTLPMAKAGLATGVLLTFVPMTGEYIIPSLLGGNKGILIGGIIAGQYLDSLDYPLGAAMAVLVLLVLGVAVVILTRVSRGFTEAVP